MVEQFPSQGWRTQPIKSKDDNDGSEDSLRQALQVRVRTYVQIHEKHNNSMELRMSSSIALLPSGNEQGGHYFLSLHTGKRILRNHWTVFPMPNDVVDAVHRLAATPKRTWA